MPEDNKLLVPPFSKKEVKAIAVEGVNEAIEDGKINIPAAGTKLYRHILKGNYSNSKYQNLIIVTTNPTNIKSGLTSTVEAYELISVYAFPGGTGTGASTGFGSRSTGRINLSTAYASITLVGMFIDASNQVTTDITVSLSDIDSDTVTEL